MNRKWNGFLPQNELVKLAWAALEESRSFSADAASDSWCKPGTRKMSDQIEAGLEEDEIDFLPPDGE